MSPSPFGLGKLTLLSVTMPVPVLSLANTPLPSFADEMEFAMVAVSSPPPLSRISYAVAQDIRGFQHALLVPVCHGSVNLDD